MIGFFILLAFGVRGKAISKGYHNQFEGNWVLLHDNQAVVGRAMTALYMPKRPKVMDGRWSDEIKTTFLEWVVNNPEELPMSKADLVIRHSK